MKQKCHGNLRNRVKLKEIIDKILQFALFKMIICEIVENQVTQT